MTVDLTDDRDAQARGWGPPPTAVSKMVDVHAGGVTVSVHHRIAELVAYCLDQTVARGYHLRKGECFGYSPRHILNDPSKPWSNHAWGLAVDLNSLENGYGSHGDFPPRIAHELWNHWGFRWGGDYLYSPGDPMHFEFMGTPGDADTLTKRLGDGTHAQRRRTVPPVFPGIRREGDHGHAVELIQAALKVRVDGLYGPVTAEAVRRFQRTHHLRADSVVGPLTWRKLFG